MGAGGRIGTETSAKLDQATSGRTKVWKLGIAKTRVMRGICCHFTNRFKKLEGQILLNFLQIVSSRRSQKEKVGCGACGIWRCCNGPQLPVSQVSGKGQGSSWYEYVSWPPRFLLKFLLLLPALAEHFPALTSTVPSSGGCCGVWDEAAYFGW